MENTQLIITPKTKVLELIEAYPHLEDVLIKYVPAFSKLKNPLLRRTVAKIATLQQAASIGNVKTGDLINLLRKEAGQELMNAADDTTRTANTTYVGENSGSCRERWPLLGSCHRKMNPRPIS